MAKSQELPNPGKWIIIAAIIIAVTIFARWSPPKEDPGRDWPGLTPTPSYNHSPQVADANPQVTPPIPEPVRHGEAVVIGTLMDRSGGPVRGMTVSIHGGPETITDSSGSFVLKGVPHGYVLIEVKPPSAKGVWTRHVDVASAGPTEVNIIYDPEESSLGLLSITAPIKGGVMPLERMGNEYFGVIEGRCDGLIKILGAFEIWILVRPRGSEQLWVQRPAVIPDTMSNTWRGDARFGAPETPPLSGQSWEIIAVAAKAGSQMNAILTTPTPSALPPHVRSNVVFTKILIQP